MASNAPEKKIASGSIITITASRREGSRVSGNALPLAARRQFLEQHQRRRRWTASDRQAVASDTVNTTRPLPKTRWRARHRTAQKGFHRAPLLFAGGQINRPVNRAGQTHHDDDVGQNHADQVAADFLGEATLVCRISKGVSSSPAVGARPAVAPTIRSRRDRKNCSSACAAIMDLNSPS